MSEMLSILSKKNKEAFSFDYTPEHIDEFYNYVSEKRGDFINKRVFASRFDNEKLVELLENSSSKQIRTIRSCFLSVYSFSNINEFFMDDKESLKSLKEKVENLIVTSHKIDKIQKLQLNYFVSDLDVFIKKLS